MLKVELLKQQGQTNPGFEFYHGNDLLVISLS